MTILDRIIERTRVDLGPRKAGRPADALRAEIASRPPPRDFVGALRRGRGAGIRVIAELKKASPSKGLIRTDFRPADHAREYAANGAAALSVLTEIHNDVELDAVLPIGPDVIGVNSRDLKTFHVDLAVTERLLRRIPASVVRVAESGIRTRDDVLRLAAAGADAFLVGESLMREPSPGRKLRELLGTGTEESS